MPRRSTKHGATGYKAGCRCAVCREGKRVEQAKYVAMVKQRDGVTPTQKYRPAKRRPCSDCGRILRSGGVAEKPRCQPCLLANRLRERRAESRRARVRHALAVAALGVSPNPGWPWVQGQCLLCDAYFVRKGASSSYCSSVCRRSDIKAKWITKSARKRIYERDGWVCQLCDEPVDPGATDVWRPTLDHIVPRSKGGSDDPSNLRLAHMWCNSVRGDESFYTAEVLRAAG